MINWLFRSLLSLYPQPFRMRFGVEMQQVFDDRRRMARDRGGILGEIFLLGRTAPDVAAGALAARRRRRRAGHDGPYPSGAPRPKDPPMSHLLRDLRHAARLLRMSPGFTAAAVLTLALGIGVNTAVFSLVNAALVRPVPGVAEPDQIVTIYTADGGSPGVSSYMDYLDMRERMESLDGIVAFKPRLMDLTASGSTERLDGMMVSGNYFEVLGVETSLGRPLTPADDREPDAHAVVVLSHGLWQRRFGADPGIIGDSVRLNGREFTIQGVTPPGFRGTWLESGPDLFVPMMMQAHFMPSSGYLLDRRGWSGTLLLGRLTADTSIAVAQAELDQVGAWINETYPDIAGTREYSMVPLRQGTLLPSIRSLAFRTSTLLMGLVALVLLVACVNVASLMLARSNHRRREVAVRQALGAGRLPIIRQVLIESLLVSSLGAAAGLAVSSAMVRVFSSLPLPFSLDMGIDWRVLAFTAAAALTTGLLCGVVPAVRASRSDIVGRLHEGDARTTGAGLGLGRLLVVAQVAVSVVLLVAAGLLTRTVRQLEALDPGFQAQGVATIGLDPALQGYEDAQSRQLLLDLVDRVSADPRVAGVSWVNALPGPTNDNVSSYQIEGYEPPDGRPPRGGFNYVGPDYLATMGIPILAGRGLSREDSTGAPSVMVVNQAAADTIEQLTGRPALGAFVVNGEDRVEIVGVAANSRTLSLRREAQPHVYIPYLQVSGWWRTVVVARTIGSPEPVVSTLRGAAQALDPGLPIFAAGTLAGHLRGTLAQERWIASLIAGAAVLALALALIGLYGVLAYAVSQRTSELGIRMALGARREHVVRMVLRRGAVLAAAGLLLGVFVAAGSSRFLSSFLFGVTGTDPLTYVLVALVLLAVALVAAWVPARRATRIDPAIALRAE